MTSDRSEIQQEAKRITTHHLPLEAVQRFLEYMPDYVKAALIEKTAELECPIESVVEMAIASFIDEEAFSFEDCLLAQRSQKKA
jgi:hypothetical protein